METTKPKLWTECGLKELGKVIKQSRVAKGWSLRELEAYIEEFTGHKITNSTLSGLERANREPNWNTLAIVAAAQFCLKEDGRPYTVEEFCDIASECYNPKDLKKSDSLHVHSDIVYPDYVMGANMNLGFWEERTCLRVQALIKESLRKQGLAGQPGTAAEQAGINPATFDRAALRAFASGSIDRMTGTGVTPELVDAIAAICYEVMGGWNADHTPRNLGSNTYKGRGHQLLNDLLNHEHQRV